MQGPATSYNFHRGPVQLIAIDEQGKCGVRDEAAELLRQIPGHLAIIGVAGSHRSGKSFLLNRLLGRQSGFEMGPTVNACTKGLWIWGEPVKISHDCHCLLLDTEGLGSAQRTASCDMQIFTLCVLLSSYLIYNSVGVIDELAIDDLHLALHLANNIHGKSAAGDELSQFFPSLMWVLRDFHLDLAEDENPKQYLERSLRQVPGQEMQNKVRKAVGDIFPERDCATLVRPCENEADIRYCSQLPYESLRHRFRIEMEALTQKVYKSVRPKRIAGANVSGTMLLKLASEYCTAINDNGVPAIQSTWSNVVQSQLRQCLREAMQAYRSHMNENVMEKLPMAEERIYENHKAAKADALRIFMKPKFDVNDPTFIASKTELSRRMKAFHESAKTENANGEKVVCMRVARELYTNKIEKKLATKGAYSSVAELMKDWDELRQAYTRETPASPAQAQILSAYLFERMHDSVKQVEFETDQAGKSRGCTFGWHESLMGLFGTSLVASSTDGNKNEAVDAGADSDDDYALQSEPTDLGPSEVHAVVPRTPVHTPPSQDQAFVISGYPAVIDASPQPGPAKHAQQEQTSSIWSYLNWTDTTDDGADEGELGEIAQERREYDNFGSRPSSAVKGSKFKDVVVM